MLGVAPQDAIVVNEGLGWDPYCLLKSPCELLNCLVGFRLGSLGLGWDPLIAYCLFLFHPLYTAPTGHCSIAGKKHAWDHRCGVDRDEKGQFELSHEKKKKTPTFHYTGWLIGILTMVY